MKYIYNLFHQYDISEFNKKFKQRISSDSVIRFCLNIKPIDQPNIYELFYVPTNRIIDVVSKIYKLSSELNYMYNQLPSVAKDQFISECLVEELFHTNELEGVKSSRDEIAKSVRNVKMKKRDNRRFYSMVKLYMNLTNSEIFFPRNPVDIRNIYDEITEGEIEESELPDGEIFRKEVTHVLSRSGSGKVIHRGIHPEKKIIEEINNLLDFMNKENSIPPIIKVAVGHYYFGYIHPFYDGNGRTSRFISSLYLADTLGNIPALSLSRGCNKFKTKYLEAFEITNSIMNKGEMNFFIDTFLDIILITLTEMRTELKEKDELLNIAKRKLQNDTRLTNKKYFDFMYILTQYHFFQSSNGMTYKELAKEMDVSEATIRKIAKDLLGQSLIKKEGIRPAYLVINPEYFEQ